MDQQLNSLDPKLREAYERVMGMKVQPKVQTAAQTAPDTQSPNGNNPTGNSLSQANEALTSDKKPVIPDIPTATQSSPPATTEPASPDSTLPQATTPENLKPDQKNILENQSTISPQNPNPQDSPAGQPHDQQPKTETPAEPAAFPVQELHKPAEKPLETSAHPDQPAEIKTSDAPFPPKHEQSTAYDSVVANNQMHAYVAQEVAGVKQSLKVIQLIYIVGGFVFFAVYVLFWMKFFNVASPF